MDRNAALGKKPLRLSRSGALFRAKDLHLHGDDFDPSADAWTLQTKNGDIGDQGNGGDNTGCIATIPIVSNIPFNNLKRRCSPGSDLLHRALPWVLIRPPAQKLG